ncbi:WYL domain-containing protein [Pseudomonas sp. 148P]|uniref:WYL domain-containing protein n=1 Tax=Pseudomonas ulcerans TaxID=3115852 RepID=A0ABU7HSV6_9PSED|nr:MULTISPECIES: WYL domain-containing protein [unclassified Pseudomonas]MEE1920683.1 WYL domain-containing protein [Pseudomonas sp. 147P]MEE1934626.1 WYL domain-containing protein [Pseudomonas sp. 148P]
MAATDHDTLALRLADILRLLQGGERPTRLQLAERFGVSERTIYRDLNRLGDVVEPAADGVYQLASQYRSHLSPADLQTFARVSGVEQLFPTSDRRSWLELLKPGQASFLVRDGHFAQQRPDTQDFRALSLAIERQRRCRLVYTGKPRQVEPYRLVHNKGIWYLAATEDGQLKSFSLGRIEDLRVLDDTFEPDPDTRRQIDGDDDIWFGQDQLTVTVQVAASNAYYFLRRNVLPHQQLIEQQADGELRLRCQVNHPNQLLPIIRYWLPHVRILEPAWLQQQLRDELTDYLNDAGPRQ